MRNIKTILFVFILLFSVRQINSQEYPNSISGRITDAETGEPLPNANVFLSGTSSGTSSDNDGKFIIKSIYPAEYELVVSMIGFDSDSKIYTIKRTSKINVDFRLIPKAYVLDRIEVLTKKPDEWFESLRLFKRLFLGRTQFADQCEIENEEYLNFNWNKNILTANIDRPLKIINRALGYELFCELQSFSYNDGSFHLRYIIKPFFKEMNSDDPEEKAGWEFNRRKAYLGSIDHFLKSFINNNFVDNGYQVSLTKSPVENRNGFRENLWVCDSLITKIPGTDVYQVTFDNYLEVIYDESGYGRPPKSWLRLIIPGTIIDKFGYPQEIIPFETYGHWARIGVANMLPKYYYVN